ncbi:hypothetical protein [Nocardioides humi]|uniref:Phosphotransferase enzyme family protein n=1 Tax=Nocardioides humi TaxID=449461 RepID=A0ABN2A2Q2_9ACTN|nr:hypothetical protein [Nocardioides humi]
MSADLLETAAELWPGADVVPAGTAGDGRPVRARYAVVSRGSTPTVLVPVDSSVAAGASLRRISTASSWWDSTARVAAGAAVRAVPGLLRHRVEVRGGDDGLAEHLSSVLGTPVSFSITIGTARVNRKPVLQVFDEQGRCRAFAKVGWSDHTCADVAAEGRALAAVTSQEYRYVVPPPLIARTSWRGRPVLLAGPLAPSPWQRHRSSWTPPVAAMDELAGSFSIPDGPLAESAWWRQQWQVAGSLADPVSRGRLGRAMERVAAITGSRPLSWGAWHGDWTPWNMAVSGERVLLWDWERFETGVPTGLDPLHYVVNALNAGFPSSPEGVLRALAFASYPDRSLGGEPHVRSLLYLVAILTRYLSLVEAPGGEHISPRATLSLIALERLLE